ncbi:hypothetical protein [Sulfitobacter sp. HI0076]|uniref:hypothetical protein n=1 Tax=Sulfitobacter sp. HI0076 TaxID=1822251 RepID=UPI0012377B38|nr:hypothetical protein [Sulfitobacter sp. HI0076]
MGERRFQHSAKVLTRSLRAAHVIDQLERFIFAATFAIIRSSAQNNGDFLDAHLMLLGVKRFEQRHAEMTLDADLRGGCEAQDSSVA